MRPVLLLPPKAVKQEHPGEITVPNSNFPNSIFLVIRAFYSFYFLSSPDKAVAKKG